jgi:hypothetical protein
MRTKGEHVLAVYRVLLSNEPWSSITVQPGAEGEVVMTINTMAGESTHRLATYDVMELAEAFSRAVRDEMSRRKGT